MPTLPESEINEPYYDTIEIGYAWLQGFRPDRYWKNTTNCFDRMTNFSFYEVPALQKVIDDDYVNTYDTVEAVFYSVRNFSDHMWICNDAL